MLQRAFDIAGSRASEVFRNTSLTVYRVCLRQSLPSLSSLSLSLFVKNEENNAS